MTSDRFNPIYGIDELAELGGVTRRTVRYYVKRGLIPPPTGTGRGKHYAQAHLDALLEVKRLQEQGVGLAEILEQRQEGDDAPASPSAPAPEPAPGVAPLPAQEPWTRVKLDEGVELHLRGPRRALDSETIATIRQAVLAALGVTTGA